MPKRLSDNQKEEMINRFRDGTTIDQLSIEFGFTKLTISRNLKKSLGDDLFKNYVNKIDEIGKSNFEVDEINAKSINKVNHLKNNNSERDNFSESSKIDENGFFNSSFMEIVPIDYEFDNEPRKELSSTFIDEIKFPNVVFMVVDRKIELEIKLLRDYPDWHFLPEKDLNLKTIKIYSELKDAKRDCKKDQKVIKVPNTNVFKIASRMMLARGISRIICDNELIALED